MGPAAHRHALCEELPARVNCWEATRSLAEERFLFLLDSAGENPELGRYSILAWCPRWEFLARDGVAWAGPPGAAEPLPGAVLDELERTLAAFAAPDVAASGDDPPPVFRGGAVGFFAYELLHEIERVTPSAAPGLGVADCHLLFCDVAVVTDEVAGRSWILCNGWGATDAECRAECGALLAQARAACADAEAGEGRGAPVPPAAGRRLRAGDLERHGVRALTAPARYLELVELAREHIFAGDVFELCLTQRFDTEFDGPGIDLYGAMRAINPAPMAAYLRYPALEVLSCSPERFLRVDGERWVETRPIKGTRPRGRDALEDQALAVDLAHALKDGAENVMIVDLARNDLGRVCEFGTVTVPTLRAVERYPSVYQLMSTVRGRLRPDATPVQLLRAAFPGGSMTGAPKVEAMRLISAMEDSRRGVFSGAIGYINYSGELDLSIVIRTVLKRGRDLCFHTGGAVTSDSEPAEEYQETLDKACALVLAIETARAAAVRGAEVASGGSAGLAGSAAGGDAAPAGAAAVSPAVESGVGA
jgi:para-aminobenzoate synthetase component 1